MADQKPMTKEDAERIQAHADKTGENQDFKGRAQRAADKPKSDGSAEVTPKK